MKEPLENQNNELPHGSGAIYNLIGWLGDNKITVYFLTFLLFLAGLNIYNSLPKEQFPSIVSYVKLVLSIHGNTQSSSDTQGRPIFPVATLNTLSLHPLYHDASIFGSTRIFAEV